MKAVIMAGGEGSRLRPLTCDMPKPLAEVCGKPVIKHITELLESCGVDEASVTLHYLPNMVKEYFEDIKLRLKLNFVLEEKPLGTAGSVKNAAKNFDEPFIVISGDAMCSFRLDKIMDYHISQKAAVTIAVSNVSDPREYGLVRYDEKGFVTGFSEKPGWEQAVCSTANTGIYIINPEVLELIPDNEKYDFAGDLFPKMLNLSMPIAAYRADGYWCDIGDIGEYLRCQRDVLELRAGNLSELKLAQGIYSKGVLSQTAYHIIPPVYIGEKVEIGSGAVIGPHSVIGDGCCIGENSKIRGSVLLDNVYIGNNCTINSALVCRNSSVKSEAQMYEGSVLGFGSILGRGAVLDKNVLVWPEKNIGEYTCVKENVKEKNIRRELFDDSGVYGISGVELTAESCARLGSAIGSVSAGERVGIACDDLHLAKSIKTAVSAGLMFCGSHIWSFEGAFEAQLDFFTSFCGLEMGIYVSDNGIRLKGKGGLPIKRSVQREIEKRFSKGDFIRCTGIKSRGAADMSSIQMIYHRELCRQASCGLEDISVTVNSENETIERTMEECLEKLGAQKGDGLVFKIDKSGRSVELFDKYAGKVSYENLLAICCAGEAEKGNDISLPFDAPEFLDEVALTYGVKVYRYLDCSGNDNDDDAHRITLKQIWVRDALFLIVKILSQMKEKQCLISDLLNSFPDVYVEKRTVKIQIKPSELANAFSNSDSLFNYEREGFSLRENNGVVRVIPSRIGDRIRIISESNTQETAKEFCDKIENILKGVSLDNAYYTE